MQGANNYLDERFIEQVKSANNIVDIISSYVDLKKMGDNYKGLCPFHNEKTPSFVVNENKQIFKCFGCGEGGNAITFLMRKENIDFVSAMKILCEKARIDFPTNGNYNQEALKLNEKKQRMYDLHINLAKYYFENMQKNIENSMIYLKKRGIDEKTIRKFGIGYETSRSNIVEYLINLGYTKEELLESMVFREKNGNIYSIFFSRIMYPIFDYKNRVVAFGGRITQKGEPKYLNSPESIIFKKKEQLYGLNFVKKYNAKRIILVEGYMDVIRLNQNGIVGAVASLGTSLTKEQSEIIKKQNKKVYICYDSDKAGRIATIRAIEILENVGVKPYIIRLDDYKDPDEFFNNNSSSDFMKKIDTAISTLSFIIDDLKINYNLNVHSQKLEFIDKACEKIKIEQDEVEKEYQVKRISNITNTSIKAIGAKVYGKYFSPKQFKIPAENINYNKDKKIIPKVEKIGNQINEKNLIQMLYQNPNYITNITDILELEDILDDKIKEYYIQNINKEKYAISQEENQKLRRLALLTKIDKIQEDILNIEKQIKNLETQNLNSENINKINLFAQDKIKLIKKRDSLKEEIKGMI